MNNFVKKALEKIDQLDTKQIVQVINNQENFIQTLERVLDSLPQGVILLNDKMRVSYINYPARHLPATKRMRNYDGFSVYDIIQDNKVNNYLKEMFEKGESDEDNEFNYQWGDEIKTYEISISPIICAVDETIDLHLIIFDDITASKRNDTRLRRSESLASMTTMAAGVAHEIKNPLAAMGIHLQLLTKTFEKKGTLTYSDAERYINVLSEEIYRLNSIVVDFLFAVRPMDTQLKLCSLTKILNEICEFVEPELEEHNIKLVRRFKTIPKLEIDSNLFKQVLLNIIKNAMNATEKGSITIETRLSGDNIKLFIRDTGIGMDEKTQSKIFEPYFTTKATGTGLGLTVCYKVIKEHRGDISVSSKVGKGTEFLITIPVPHSQRLAIDHLSNKSHD
ncbi:MAG: histidine kinase [Spirochaetaceae bacterium]|nr:histidine kinase [Spirochaetaceae bacterium]